MSINPNSILSESDHLHYADEFMPASQQGNDPMFENFMQACLNNPSFFQSMKQFYTQANQPKPTPAIPNNRNNNPIQANPYNLSGVSQQSSRNDEFRGSYDDEDELESTSQMQFKKEERKLPANPLLKYQPQEKNGSAENSNTSSRRVIQQEIKKSPV